MKIVVIIVRILLGVIFVAFGLNAYLHFLPKPLPPGIAGEFVGAMFQSHYIIFVGALRMCEGGAREPVSRAAARAAPKAT